MNLKNVDFSYNKDVELIKNLNLNVKDGQRIAIVGNLQAVVRVQ